MKRSRGSNVNNSAGRQSATLDDAAKYRLINWAKTQLPDAVTYFTPVIAIPNFDYMLRVHFRKVTTPYGPKWEYEKIDKLKISATGRGREE